jgi:group I intron endonuclease
MKKIGIYKITNPSGKIYIGASKDILKRWNSDYKYICNVKSQIKLYKSFKKYGISNHTFEIVEICNVNFLFNKEIYWINFYNSYVSGLNSTKGGENPPLQNKPKSEQHKEKIRNSKLGQKHSIETKQKIREKRLIQVFSKESINRASKTRSKPCILINKFTNEIWKANSLKELVKICPISQAMLMKLNKKETKQYKFKYESKQM